MNQEGKRNGKHFFLFVVLLHPLVICYRMGYKSRFQTFFFSLTLSLTISLPFPNFLNEQEGKEGGLCVMSFHQSVSLLLRTLFELEH